MDNPFAIIDRRLSNIEHLLLSLDKPAPQSVPLQDEYLTRDEVAALLKVTKVTVWQWSKPEPGILKPLRIGNKVRYLKSEVLQAAQPAGKGGQAV